MKGYQAMFLPPAADVQARVDHIVNTYTGLVMQGKKKLAAYLSLMATGEVHGFTVVTEETGPESLQKIWSVCRALKVPSINLMEPFNAEDWVIG